MKKILTLGTLLLGCCLTAAAQTGSTPNQMPPSSTPSTFPQDQTGQTPSNPATPADPSAIPPDSSAPGTQASNSQATTIQGCLNQSADGNFMLADNAGNNYQLHGDNTQLATHLGEEIQVQGIAESNNTSATPAGAMSSPTSNSASSGSSPVAATQFSVRNVHKIADNCTMGSSTSK